MAHKASSLFRGLIVENTFSSTPDLVNDLFTFVKYIKSLITDTWYSRDLVGSLQLPILFIAGAKDSTVLPHHSIDMQKLSTKSAFSLNYIVENGDHNTTWEKGGQEYIDQLKSFISKCSSEYPSKNTQPPKQPD
jgi:pimeloyl-ACP methyl ester carboxylesterase